MKLTASKIILLILSLVQTVDFTASPKSNAAILPAEPIAVVTQISGVVKVKPAGAGKPKSIDSTMLLYENDELWLGREGSAALFQVNLVVERLKENDRRTIKPASPPPPKGAFTREQMSWWKQQVRQATNNFKKKSPTKKRRKKLFALSLRFGLLLDPRPILAWTPVKGTGSYVIKLYDSVNNVIWSKTTSDSQVTYDAPALVSGKYKWGVTTQGFGQTFRDATPFIAIEKEEAEQIRTELQLAREVTHDSDTVNLAYVAACLQYRQYSSAEEELKRGLRRSPLDKMLWTLLAETYQSMQRWEDREMARKFRSKLPPVSELQRFLMEENPK